MRRLALILLPIAAAIAPQIGHGQSTVTPQTVVRYHYGDNPLWADPRFDDSAWSVAPDSEIPAPPFDSDGFVWVRAHVPVPAGDPASFGICQQDPELAPNAEELYVNGVFAGRNGSLPPHTVSMVALEHSVLPLPAGLVEPGSTAVVVLRAWVQPDRRLSLDLRGPVPSAPASFTIDRLPVLSTAVEDRYLLNLMTQGPMLFLQLLLVLLGFALLVMWRWFRRRELVLFGIVLLSGGAYLLFILLTDSGLILLSRRDWMFLWIPLQFITPAAWVFFVWTALSLPGRLWQRVAIGFLSLAIVSGCVAMWAYQPSPLVAFCTVTEGWWFNLYCLVILIAAVWHLAVRRTNWALAIAITAPSIVSLLSNSIGLPPVHLGFLTTTYYDIGLTAGSFAVVALLIEGTWRTWQQGNNLSIEFEAAREIQHQLVTSPPDLPGFHIACVYTPAQQVGGDFFRILPQPGGGVLVVVGDVSGKGLRAAMTVAAIMGALRTISGGRPEDILLAMNRSLAGSMRGGFVTCLCAQITSDGAVTLANAGHLSPYRNGAELEANPGFPLGISAQAEYPETHLHLAPGDTLTFITDGIVEARNAQGELFGFERTCAISTQPAEKIAQTAQAFGQEDDITVLTVTLTPAEVLHA